MTERDDVCKRVSRGHSANYAKLRETLSHVAPQSGDLNTFAVSPVIDKNQRNRVEESYLGSSQISNSFRWLKTRRSDLRNLQLLITPFSRVIVVVGSGGGVGDKSANFTFNDAPSREDSSFGADYIISTIAPFSPSRP